MSKIYTAKFERTSSGYVGQLLEWLAVISEGSTIEECREMLLDAAREMAFAYREEGLPIPEGADFVDRVPVEV